MLQYPVVLWLQLAKKRTTIGRMENGAATKQDLENLKKELVERQDQLEQRLMDRVQEVVRDAQTEILRGFAAYAQSNELRMRRVEAGMLNLHGDDDAMNQRLAKIESRMLEIEMKVMGGPQA